MNVYRFLASFGKCSDLSKWYVQVANSSLCPSVPQLLEMSFNCLGDVESSVPVSPLHLAVSTVHPLSFVSAGLKVYLAALSMRFL